MNAIAPRFGAALMASAEVIEHQDGRLLVLLDGASVTARRALSCLVVPVPGDTVLIGGSPLGFFVIAVLDRIGGAPQQLAVDGDLELAASGGITLRAARMRLVAGEAALEARDVTLSGDSLTARFGRIALVAEAVEAFVTRLLTRARRSYRFVEETEQLRAGAIDSRATGHVQLRGGTASIQAGALVKIDAAQIQMG